MNVCPRCGKVTPDNHLHTCTPCELTKAEKNLNDLFDKESDVIVEILRKLRKPIQGLAHK